MDMIKLPLDLGMIVSQTLKEKHNIEPRENNMGMMSFEYTLEELKLITSISLTNPVEGSLVGVELLPNLKSISVNSKEISAHLQDKNIASISDKDVDSILKCPSLESLSIVNQAKIDSLNISKLSKLKRLEITHNNRLESLEGLETLNDLYTLSVYGNNIMFDVPDFGQTILKNPDLYELNLDVLLFPNAINYNTKNGEYNKELVAKLKEISDMGKVKWSESRTYNRSIPINTGQMIRLHNKACKILSENVPETAGIRDTVIGIESYLAQNVQYDYDGKDNNHTNFIPMNINGTLLKIQNGPKVGTNSAYNALMFNKCVCQGYTRGMQYLLKLKGIDSHDVDCYAGADVIGMADGKGENMYTIYNMPDSTRYHSMICIDDFYCLYDDPCWNAVRYQSGDKSMDWVLRTKAEISKDHILSFEERNVSNNHLSQESKVIQASLKSIELFKNSRTSSVNGVKGNISKHIKGQIIEKEGNEI